MNLQQISTGSNKGNCYKYKSLMLDCGIPYTRLVNKSKGINHLEDVRIIFISHIHSDHMYFTSRNGERTYSTARKIGIEYPNILWVTGSEDVTEIFKELGLKHLRLEMNKLYPFKIDEEITKLELIKLYHDVENYGLRVFDELKGIYITDTAHIQGITFKGYDWIIIELNHDVKTHLELAENSEYPKRYLNALDSHLNFAQTFEAISKFAKKGTEILFVHLSSDEVYQQLGLVLHYKQT